MRKILKSKIINALLGIDQEDSGLLGCIGRSDSENDVLHKNRLAASGASGDQRVRRMLSTGREKELATVIFPYSDQDVLVFPTRRFPGANGSRDLGH